MAKPKEEKEPGLTWIGPEFTATEILNLYYAGILNRTEVRELLIRYNGSDPYF